MRQDFLNNTMVEVLSIESEYDLDSYIQTGEYLFADFAEDIKTVFDSIPDLGDFDILTGKNCHYVYFYDGDGENAGINIAFRLYIPVNDQMGRVIGRYFEDMIF